MPRKPVAGRTGCGSTSMLDLLFIAVAVIAFVVTALYLPACDGW
jgi:hypothetical protein